MRKDKNCCVLMISGVKRYKLLDHIVKCGIECEQIQDRNEMLFISTHTSNIKRIERLAAKYGSVTQLQDKHISIRRRLIKNAMLHSGLVVGIVISIILCSVFSHMILRINIENDSEQVRADILSVLDENGLHIGSFKDGFDYVKLERELKRKVNGISWVGISEQGSTLVIDTIDNIPKPVYDNKRLPCNVVALHDCVVDKAEVFCGDLNVKIGSGVRAGDILISGERKKLISSGKDNKETEVTQYMRASGRVYGTFEKQAEFFYPYEQYINTPTGKEITVNYLNIFDADIPLFIRDIEGTYTYNAIREPVSVFGIELPVALTKVEYSEYTEAINTFTDEQIAEKIESSIRNYETELLTGYEIKDLKKTVSRADDGVTVKLIYTLYGEIGEQADIYLNKE